MISVARAALCALIGACALASGPATAAASDAPAAPLQGVYEWCDASRAPDACAQRLQRIGRAGFGAVANGWSLRVVSEDAIRAYAASAAAAGVQVVWPLHALRFHTADPRANDLLSAYPDLAARCQCSDNQGLLAHLIAILRGLPNTWGYYLADEPKPDARPALTEWVSRVRALDPDHPRIIMGCGVCAGGAATNVNWLADLDIAVGTDAYPVFGGPPDPRHAYASVALNVATMDLAARAAGRRQVVALQAWRWGDSIRDSQAAQVDPASTRFPTREEIQAQRDATIDNAHPDLILWFTLTQVIGWVPGQELSHWANPTDSDQRWANLIGGAFAPVPSRTTAAQPQTTPVSVLKPRNRAPRARFTILRGNRTRHGTRFIADARASRDPDGRILRYVWRLNGKRLAGDRSPLRAFRIRRAGAHRFILTITDDRGAKAGVQRRFRVPRARSGPAESR
ncbi:MAG TPA: hypothetical protein VFO85_17615 [Vicinamibacteria bacterium]|nr:hypothetical protein [Vicinamibacteria bacterium]